MTRPRRIGAVSAVAATLVAVLLALEWVRREPRAPAPELPRFSRDSVHVASDRDRVMFTNADGRWTIFKRCLGTDVAGVAYIARYVSRLGYVVSNDYREGGFGELNNPRRGGIGTFGLELARGAGHRDWENTQHLSMRRCGAFGVTKESAPAFGRLADGTAYYHQTVWLGDAWVERMVRVRYRWRFRRSGVDLRGTISVLCGDCPSELGEPYAKEPKLVVTLNGRAGRKHWTHMSTFDDEGRWASETDSGQNRECSYDGSNPYQGTGHCFLASRERVRWDFANDASGGCSSARPCFNAVLRALDASGPKRWESRAGLEGWAWDAARSPRAGADGCVTIEGEPVFSPAHENARNWEYAGFKSDGEHYDSSMVMAKAWDGCRNPLDATSLYRRLERGSYGFFLSLSLGEGWARE